MTQQTAPAQPGTTGRSVVVDREGRVLCFNVVGEVKSVLAVDFAQGMLLISSSS